MKCVKGNFGKIYFGDCVEVMRYLLKKYDLALADPPYNQNFKGFHGSPSKNKENIIYYPDNMSPEDYREWCKEWFKELQRISKRQMVSCGLKNKQMWYEDQDVFDEFGHFDPTGGFGSRVALYATYHPWLCFGKFNQELTHNCIKVVHVFRKDEKEHDSSHPCPRPPEVIEYIITNLKPKSVIDPFMGSGMTAMICEKYGVKYIGFEKMIEYAPEIKKKIAKGIWMRKKMMKKKKGLLQYK